MLKPIGALIKQYRKEKNISQIDLAVAVGSTQPFMCQIENGVKSPSIEMLERIANALEQPMAMFLIEESSYTNGRKILVVVDIDVFHQNKVSGSDLSWIVECVGKRLRLGDTSGVNNSTNTPYKFTYKVKEK